MLNQVGLFEFFVRGRGKASGIHVVYPSARFLSAKVRVFRDFLVNNFSTFEP